jgi:hypothetical protein
MEHDSEVMEVIRGAFEALQGTRPEVLARISSAIESARSHASEIQEVEVAFRNAAKAKALVSIDKATAQTLFTAAQTLRAGMCP